MFDRNIGIFSETEQQTLRKKAVAVLGCGGMGSISSQILARSGIESLIIADFDKYNDVNINNQFCAFKSTIGRNKAEVVGETLNDINPAASIKVYSEGRTEKNVSEIVAKADIIYDCIDYNELYYSYILTSEARKQNKFVLAPQAIGYGASVLIFDPRGLSFNEFLGLKDGMNREEVNAVNVPAEKYAPIRTSYIQQETIEKVVMKKIAIPNIALAQTLASSIMIAESFFILLGKRKSSVIPEVIAIDLFEKKYIA